VVVDQGTGAQTSVAEPDLRVIVSHTAEVVPDRAPPLEVARRVLVLAALLVGVGSLAAPLLWAPFVALFNSELLYPAYRALPFIVDVFFHVMHLAVQVPAVYHALAFMFALDYYAAWAPVIVLLGVAVYLRRQVSSRLGGRAI
jgi:hypothetical protein